MWMQPGRSNELETWSVNVGMQFHSTEIDDISCEAGMLDTMGDRHAWYATQLTRKKGIEILKEL